MKKLITEFFRININGKAKTVAIRRNEYDFDNIDMESNRSVKLWKILIDKVIEEMFNTNEWEYLGYNEYNYPKQNEPIIFIEYKNI